MRQAWHFLLSKSADATTADGRSKERYRRTFLSALAALTAKAVSVVTLLVSVPMLLTYLGSERYGLWMTMSSVFAALLIADLGIGNGLLNSIADSHGKDAVDEAREYVSSALFMLLALTIGIAAILLIVAPLVQWARLFGAHSPLAISEVPTALGVYALCFLIGLPLSIVQRTRAAYQEAYANSKWEALSSIVALAGLLAAIRFQLGLPALIAIGAGTPLLSTLGNGAVLFGRERPNVRPAWTSVVRRAVDGLTRRASLFLVLQVTATIIFVSDNIVADWICGPADVALYATTARAFACIPMLAGIALSPIWPAYAEARARGDLAWVKHTFLKSLVWTLALACSASLLLVVFGDRLIPLWTSGRVNPSHAMLLGFGISTAAISCGLALAMLLNGLNVVGFQVGASIATAVSALGLKILLTRRYGIEGLAWSTGPAYIVCLIIPAVFFVPRLFAAIEPGKAATDVNAESMLSSEREPGT